MLNSWIVLIPPLLVLAIAFTTKQILWALAFGILSAGYIAGQFSLESGVKIIGVNLLDQLTYNNFYIFAFLTALGILITLMSHTGGTAAYGNIIRGYIKNKQSAQFACMLLSLLLIFDDFFSSITTGCIMRPLTDRFKIPRIKLAYLIDSMAAPLVIAIPISSWTATLTMQLSKAGISTNLSEPQLIYGDPFFAYVESIPFIFYSFLILLSTFFIVQQRISYGMMYEQEKIAEETGNLFGGKKPKESNILYCPNKTGSLLDFILPIVFLLGISFLILLYTGGYYLLGGHYTLLVALRETDIFYALCFGSISALAASIILFCCS